MITCSDPGLNPGSYNTNLRALVLSYLTISLFAVNVCLWLNLGLLPQCPQVEWCMPFRGYLVAIVYRANSGWVGRV